MEKQGDYQLTKVIIMIDDPLKDLESSFLTDLLIVLLQSNTQVCDGMSARSRSSMCVVL